MQPIHQGQRPDHLRMWGNGVTLHSRQIPVEGHITYFNLAHCCFYNRVLKRTEERTWTEDNALQQAPLERWHGDVERFLRSLRSRGIGRKKVEETAARFPGASIGWTVAPDTRVRGADYHLCEDLAITLTVLTHTFSDLFLPRREAEWNWERLFATTLATADRRFGRSLGRSYTSDENLVDLSRSLPDSLYE